MSYPIQDIEGIGPAYAEKLGGAGIKTTADFLKHCGNAKGRKAASENCGIPEAMLLKWANLADLMRISGIGPQYSELLEAAGVDTVKELRHRRADNLTAKIREINDRKRLARSVPAVANVQAWIDAAKTTEPSIHY